MNVLVLGGSGMLGHKLCQSLRGSFDVWATLRKESAQDLFAILGLSSARIVTSVDVLAPGALERSFERSTPNVVINCVGIIKQSAAAKDPELSIRINALLPHQLAKLCRQTGARLIHISTDCVFSGRKGNYKETDISDAEDLYGKTKQLGEVAGPGALTLRTSIIGPEIASSFGLLEWFLAQKGKTVKGYKKAIFSGFTTLELSAIISKVIQYHPELSGLYQVSSAPIDKYALLQLIREQYHGSMTIEPDETVAIDRSLDSALFRSLTGYQPPLWKDMIAAMARDAAHSDKLETREARL